MLTPHDTALHDSALHDSALHDTAPHDTALHDTARKGSAMTDAIKYASATDQPADVVTVEGSRDLDANSASPDSRPGYQGRRLLGFRLVGVVLAVASALLVIAGPASAAVPITPTAATAPAHRTGAPAASAPQFSQFVYGWAAIAISPSTGSLAWSNDYPSQNEAASAAVNRCGVQDCQSVVEVADGCAAMAQASNYRLGWAAAASLSGAQNTAARYAGPRAHNLTWVCTTGHQ